VVCGVVCGGVVCGVVCDWKQNRAKSVVWCNAVWWCGVGCGVAKLASSAIET
jgi:uncharacterized membrane protein